jgi:hypothetical protein
MKREWQQRCYVGCVVGLATLLLNSNYASAAYVYSLHFDKSVYQVTPGSVMTDPVKLYFRELATDGDKNRLGAVNSENGVQYGLMTSEFIVKWSGTNRLVSGTSFGYKPADTLRTVGKLTADDTQLTVRQSATYDPDPLRMYGDPGYVVPGQTGLREVFLGSIAFNIPTAFSEDVVLSFEEESPTLSGDFIVKIGPDPKNTLRLDQVANSIQGGTAVLTAVPEPSTFALMGLAMAIGGGCWLRKRRSVVAAR